MTVSTIIEGLFAGGVGCLPEGQRSGIFKRRILGRVPVEEQGIAGDEICDTRVHGGPEKAVHQYAAENYALSAQEFAHCAGLLIPGSLGENISARHLSERNVHIGDIFRAGTAVLQVSQPRTPCWKIDHRFGAEGMSVHVARTGITGWHYRVIDPGHIQAGDSMTLLDRRTDRFSIAEFWRIQQSPQPAIDDLVEMIDIPGLAANWKHRLSERIQWLRAHSGGAKTADTADGNLTQSP